MFFALGDFSALRGALEARGKGAERIPQAPVSKAWVQHHLRSRSRRQAKLIANVKPFPWFFIRLAAPFHETLREFLEMRYLWGKPIGLDNAKLIRFLGDEPHTPIDAALQATLADMGLIEGHATGDRGQATHLRSGSLATM
jgi:hypothetical protein